MQEHPIPQDITGYRFHIVGNMTIKQFAEVGIGVVLAFILYNTNLLSFIKWPLIVLSLTLGAGAAFVPFEERPLDHWLITFVRVLYKPTKYFWRRQAKVPEAFTYEQKDQSDKEKTIIDLTPQRRARIKEYLQTVDVVKLDNDLINEQKYMDYITQIFDEVNVTQKEVGHQKTNLKVQPRAMRMTSQYQSPESGVTTKKQLDTSQVASQIAIPALPKVQVAPTVLEESKKAAVQTEAAFDDSATQLDKVSAVGATYNSALPFPDPPDVPNKIVGMVLTPNNDLINDAIIEVKNSLGQTERAVKTNALGQFFITTPLKSGTYTLSTEKEPYDFTPISVTLTGEVVKPLEIRSL